MEPSQVQAQVARQLPDPAVQRRATRSHGGREAQAVVVHETQRLHHIGDDAPRQQLPREEKVFVGKVVKAVDDKRVHSVVEPVAVVGSTTDARRVVIHVRHLPAGQNRVLRMAGAPPPRLVSRVVDFQGACELFDRARHRTERRTPIRVVLARLLHHDAQGLGLAHLDLEGCVVELKIRPFELKFPGLHQT